MNKPPDHIGKNGSAKFPDGEVRGYTIVDEIKHRQSTYGGKFFYLQKIKFDDGVLEYRFCYYIIGKKPSVKGRWVFGQFAPLIPKRDFEAIIKKAVRKGFING